MTKNELCDFIENKYGVSLLQFQRDALWDFYEKAKRGDLTQYFIAGRQNCKKITYQIMIDLLKMIDD